MRKSLYLNMEPDPSIKNAQMNGVRYSKNCNCFLKMFAKQLFVLDEDAPSCVCVSVLAPSTGAHSVCVLV